MFKLECSLTIKNPCCDMEQYLDMFTYIESTVSVNIYSGLTELTFTLFNMQCV
jgi:hypothetical protein